MTQRGEIVWSPDARIASESRLASFARGKSFDELHQWSVKSPEEFWSSIWQFCGMVGERGDRVVARTANPSDPAVEFISTRFFPDAKLSIVENFLQRTGDGEALVALELAVAGHAQGLRLGVEQRGQRIAGATKDAMEGGMAFLQKRKAEFKGE